MLLQIIFSVAIFSVVIFFKIYTIIKIECTHKTFCYSKFSLLKKYEMEDICKCFTHADNEVSIMERVSGLKSSTNKLRKYILSRNIFYAKGFSYSI